MDKIANARRLRITARDRRGWVGDAAPQGSSGRPHYAGNRTANNTDGGSSRGGTHGRATDTYDGTNGSADSRTHGCTDSRTYASAGDSYGGTHGCGKRPARRAGARQAGL